MAFYVPPGMNIARIVVLDTRYFNLLESPLRKDGICRTKVTSKLLVAETHSSCQRIDTIDMALASSLQIVHNFNAPVVMIVPDGRISVTRYFIVQLRDRSGDIM